MLYSQKKNLIFNIVKKSSAVKDRWVYFVNDMNKEIKVNLIRKQLWPIIRHVDINLPHTTDR